MPPRHPGPTRLYCSDNCRMRAYRSGSKYADVRRSAELSNPRVFKPMVALRRMSREDIGDLDIQLVGIMEQLQGGSSTLSALRTRDAIDQLQRMTAVLERIEQYLAERAA